jgi:hypothetical protein
MRTSYRPFATSWSRQELHEINYGWLRCVSVVTVSKQTASSQCKFGSSPSMKKVWPGMLSVKIMFIVFCDCQSIALYECPARYHCSTASNEAVWRKSLVLLQDNCSFLHHENLPVHTALSVWKFIVKNHIPVVPHPLYSTDLPLAELPLPKIEYWLREPSVWIIGEIWEETCDYHINKCIDGCMAKVCNCYFGTNTFSDASNYF